MENNFNFFNRVANSKEDETTPRLFSKTPRRGNRVGLKAISEKIYNENKTPLLNEGIGEQYDVQTEQKLKKFTEPFDFEEATAKDKKLPAPFIKIKKWGDEETAKVDQNKP
jgi:hypothetical protein